MYCPAGVMLITVGETVVPVDGWELVMAAHPKLGVKAYEQQQWWHSPFQWCSRECCRGCPFYYVYIITVVYCGSAADIARKHITSIGSPHNLSYSLVDRFSKTAAPLYGACAGKFNKMDITVCNFRLVLVRSSPSLVVACAPDASGW